MVSFQAPISLNHKKRNNSMSEEEEDRLLQETFNGNKKSRTDRDVKSVSDLERPLEWTRCNDIQTGKIHLYNSRTHERSNNSPDPASSTQDHNHDRHVGLNLELNSQPSEQFKKSERTKHGTGDGLNTESRKQAWKAFERGDRRQEMTATVCVQCNMLVMLCKSSPACPNCKFTHPRDPTSCDNLC